MPFVQRKSDDENNEMMSLDTTNFTKPARVGIVQACMQGLVLLIITILVTVWQERGRPADSALIALETWSVTVANPCNSHKELPFACFNTTSHNTNQTSKPLLQGYERPQRDEDNRLFSIVSVPFLILCSHVLSTPFYIGYVRETSADDSHSSSTILQKNLKRVSLVMLLVFACSFLFLRGTWRLPGNNLLLCELCLMCALFYISFHPSSHYSELARHRYTPTRYLEFAFSFPLLTIAAAATCGVTDVDDLNWLFFTSVFMCLFLLCNEYHQHSTTVLMGDEDTAHTHGTRTLMLNALLCLVALLVPASRGIEQGMQTAPKHLYWAPIALVLVSLLHVLLFLVVAGYRVLKLFSAQHEVLVALLDAISIGGRTTISLLVISGALDMQSS